MRWSLEIYTLSFSAGGVGLGQSLASFFSVAQDRIERFQAKLKYCGCPI